MSVAPAPQGRLTGTLLVLGLLLPMALAATRPTPSTVTEPYELREVRYERIRSHDGVELEGWIGLPDVPEGRRVPTVLHVSPYLGACGGAVAFGEACYASPDDPSWWAQPAHVDGWYAWKLDPIEFVRRGYAVAFFSIRGTGNSGGCFEENGHAEQLDQVVTVEWLAAQPWSDGSVGMGGVSYAGRAALAAAVHGVEALKTVVVAGLVTEPVSFLGTPQGAIVTPAAVNHPRYVAGFTAVPAVGSGPGRVEPLGSADRACGGAVDSTVVAPYTEIADERPATYFDERRLIDGFPEVTAGVLLAQGFLDNLSYASLHGFQDDVAWQALRRAPKRRVVGQWGHTFPESGVATLDPAWREDEWSELLFAWLGHWLRGVGAPPRSGWVDFQDSSGTWHSSRDWPPLRARDEVLYLSGAQLTSAPTDGERRFLGVHDPRNTAPAAAASDVPLSFWSALCDGEQPATGVAFLSGALERDAVIAGNPWMHLRLSADQPGGIVAVHLVELTDAFACGPDGQVAGVEVLSKGAADLRFHAGNTDAVDFPVATPTDVRVDLYDLAEQVPAGHRLAVVVSSGDGVFNEWGGRPHTPVVTVHGDGGSSASHVVLPLAEGSLGGRPPVLSYPPRPFSSAPAADASPQARGASAGG